MSYPDKRQATAQAWRRVRSAIGPGELRDLAADIAAVIEAESAFVGVVHGPSLRCSIEYALGVIPWDLRRQA